MSLFSNLSHIFILTKHMKSNLFYRQMVWSRKFDVILLFLYINKTMMRFIF